MRVLRSTMWSLRLEPVTMVLIERDLTVSIEEAVEQLPEEGMFFINDIFEMPDDDIKAATREAGKRSSARFEREKNMALNYYWTIGQFTLLVEGATFANTKPSPLSREELAVTLRQMAKHPSYKGYTIRCMAEDGSFVVLQDGKITDG